MKLLFKNIESIIIEIYPMSNNNLVEEVAEF